MNISSKKLISNDVKLVCKQYDKVFFVNYLIKFVLLKIHRRFYPPFDEVAFTASTKSINFLHKKIPLSPEQFFSKL